MKKVNLEKLEKADFKITKRAFNPEEITCTKCNLKMKKTEMEISIDGSIFIKVQGFECANCGKKYLGLGESKKMDKALIMSRILNKGFKMERSLSFDGDNWTFRIPKEFTASVHNKKIEIVPLGTKEFCATVK